MSVSNSAKEYRQKIWNNLYSKNLLELPWLHNPYPEELFNLFAAKLVDAKNILDYGCGNGRYYNILSQFGATVTCVDISLNAIQLCKVNNAKAETFVMDTAVQLPKEKFNGVFCWGVLHHIAPSERMLFWRGLFESLKAKGIVLVGGWSKEDIEHQSRLRISQITCTQTWDIDLDLDELINNKFIVIKKGTYSFTEYNTHSHRIFSYYLLQKDEIY